MRTFERINELAKKRGIGLRALASKAGLGETTIYGWKKRTPDSSKLESVAKVLGVSVDYLLGKEEKTTNKDYDGEVEEALNSARMYQGKPISDAQRETIKGIVKAYLDAQDKDK
ncbi:helix-turn-helix domain-containing protein [Pediococcus pentosaceus]|uniref:helix-turn-helix domain-containing protein n=1 Tax=Pediococcus pentosaceus TaxID=1255 RepID=UPI000762AC1C|nr:helix-turn-helix transcriptional regulator [Pediococcus pentosaceus]NEZ68455.1 XRE family transcriptional regulator [Pediococcus pentosaceus]